MNVYLREIIPRCVLQGLRTLKFTVSREWPARVLCNFKTQKAWSPTAYAPSTRTATPTTYSKTGGDFTALLHTIFLERKSYITEHPFYTCTACADFEGWCLSRRTLPNQSRQSFCLKFAGIYWTNLRTPDTTLNKSNDNKGRDMYYRSSQIALGTHESEGSNTVHVLLSSLL